MLTHEQKKAIYEEYLDKDNRVAEIAERYGVLRAQVARIAVEMGATPRNEKRFGQKYKTGGHNARICPKCRKTIETKGARFCCFCGSDIRSGKEIAAERLQKVMTYIIHLPVNMRDEAQQAIINAIKELKE